MYFALRTDAPQVQLLLIDLDGKIVEQDDWLAERRLAQELLGRISQLLIQADLEFTDLHGLIVYRGPGSFTGLRIGITTVNTMAYGIGVPVVGTEGDDWAEQGYKRLSAGDNDQLVLPEYGAPAHITQAKK